MRYNILLVDDEPSFCTYFSSLISWKESEYQLSRTITSAKIALTYIKQHHIDIIFTDMNMPGMNGVEFIRSAKQQGFGGVFIALSGFKDFDFVKDSLKEGALDYLIKNNLTQKSLTAVLLSAKSVCSVSTSSVDTDKSAIALSIIKKALLEADVDKAELISAFAEFQVTPQNICVMLVYPEIVLNAPNIERILVNATEIITKIVEDAFNALIIRMNGGVFSIVYSIGQTGSLLFAISKSKQLSNRIKSSLKHLLNIECVVCFSDVSSGISALYAQYNLVLERISDSFYASFDTQAASGEMPNIILDEDKIKQCLNAVQKQELLDYCNTIFDTMCRYRVPKLFFQNFSIELYTLVSFCARRIGFVSGASQSTATFYTVINSCLTASSTKRLIERAFNDIFEAAEIRDINENNSSIVQKAKIYIRNNYSKNISLIDAAIYIGVNASYLSRIFKKEVGRGFVDYLSEYRIQIAMELLKNGRKIKETANLSGFFGYNYFFKVFKELCGCTPQEYKSRFFNEPKK